ncbi:Putative auto-transporter adhesin, head GIN domain [Pustulibacterium marinum]|uniref:Putative auto-transporter adhesin, head GIN domain n=1 Tax=Pustulibacterium marinum TaxID=1224947 RepID=A0A1I7ETC5_9FLAO|nr:head GIN domain-containing protein [Pustulibacterium marinum]SFU27171.1 Putative auto-transporter adhesin, head GIN domain [Pustulibacterium marinum]
MRKLIAIGLFFIGFSAFAQNDITKTLGAFDEVKAYDGISVKLIQSNENRAIIKGKNKNDVELVNKDGILKIRMDITEAFDGYDTFVEVYHKDRLYVIDANEQAYIENIDPYKQTEITLKAQEGGEISMYLKVEKLEVKAVTGGIITPIGSATNQDISINTGGEYEGKEMESEQTTVSVNAGGNADVYATKYVDAKVRAGGNVQIYGSPKVIDQQTFLGGKIKEMD